MPTRTESFVRRVLRASWRAVHTWECVVLLCAVASIMSIPRPIAVLLSDSATLGGRVTAACAVLFFACAVALTVRILVIKVRVQYAEQLYCSREQRRWRKWLHIAHREDGWGSTKLLAAFWVVAYGQRLFGRSDDHRVHAVLVDRLDSRARAWMPEFTEDVEDMLRGIVPDERLESVARAVFEKMSSGR